MIKTILLFPLIVSFYLCIPSKNKENNDMNLNEKPDFFSELNRESYNKYMREVFTELEKDLSLNNEVDLTNSTESIELYVKQLNEASSATRTKLDEIKQREIARLNMAEKELEKLTTSDLIDKSMNHEDIHKSIIEVYKQHIHDDKSDKFTVDDLRSLIRKIQHDIKAADKVQEREYKRHELKKSWRAKKRLGKIKDPKKRKEAEAIYWQERKKRFDHRRLHEPGSSEQLKDIWEEKDHLNRLDFNPNTFFDIHDLNQDGIWDIQEVDAIVQIDIDKAYNNETNPDEIEKAHELMKMRQYMFEKIDKNIDSLITKEEFLHYTKNTNSFTRDVEWKTSQEINKSDFNDLKMKELEENLEKMRVEFEKEDLKLSEKKDTVGNK